MVNETTLKEPATRLLIFGATGTIGRAVVAQALAQGLVPVCILRGEAALPRGAEAHRADVTDPAALAEVLTRVAPCRAVISCLASRSGAPDDAWAIDHAAQSNVLSASAAPRFVLLSAICVQKPKLAFQHAKLAFEAELQASGVDYAIVRATAYFKSLSGQLARVRAGKPFMVFGDGELTACKPISDRDLARFLIQCATEPQAANAVLPIGGPGPAITPIQQGALLCNAVDKPPRYKRVPVAVMRGSVAVLSALGRVSPRMAAKAELARIGLYYATESMLVWDAASQRYDAEATPEFGADTLAQHYAALARGEAQVDLGEHAVF